MDLEELSKSQIILLTVLVSFITSIATGIVTISLLDDSPGGVSQTVHKVVERTVEKVSPKNDENMASAGGSVQKETTVVVKENDMITSSISKNMDSLVRINEVVGGERSEQASTTPNSATSSVESKKQIEFAGIGLILSKDGLIVSPKLSQGSYEVEFYNGVSLPVNITSASSKELSLLEIKGPSLKNTEVSLKPISFADISNLKLCRNVMTISGVRRKSVSIGIVSSLPTTQVTVGEGENKTTTTKISSINTDIDSNKVLTGSPLITLFNKVAGVATYSSLTDEYASYIPAYKIKEFLNEYRNAKTEVQNEKKESKETDTEQ